MLAVHCGIFNLVCLATNENNKFESVTFKALLASSSSLSSKRFYAIASLEIFYVDFHEIFG